MCSITIEIAMHIELSAVQEGAPREIIASLEVQGISPDILIIKEGLACVKLI